MDRLEEIKAHYFMAKEDASKVGALYGDSHKEWLITEVESLRAKNMKLYEENIRANDAVCVSTENSTLRQQLNQLAIKHQKLFKSYSKRVLELTKAKGQLADWKMVFGGFGEDAISVGNKWNAIRDDYEKQMAAKDEALEEATKGDAPVWYSAAKIKEWLERQGYPDYAPEFFAEHLQEAFEKGWSMKAQTIRELKERVE